MTTTVRDSNINQSTVSISALLFQIQIWSVAQPARNGIIDSIVANDIFIIKGWRRTWDTAHCRLTVEPAIEVIILLCWKLETSGSGSNDLPTEKLVK